MPTTRFMQKYWDKVKSAFQNDDDENGISSEKLNRKDEAIVDKYIKSPSYANLIAELDCTIADWLKENDTNNRSKLIILPPGDDDFMADWAKGHKITLLDEPSRESLLSGNTDGQINFPKKKTIVIPRLEKWFLRHRNGINHLRLLLAEIENSETKFIIGCNSWAWQFIIKSVNAHFVLPGAITFRPYNEMRLYDWFRNIHGDITKQKTILRQSKNGRDIFKLDKDDKPKHGFFKELAAESFGIPWVAWALLRCAIKTHNDEKTDEDSKTDSKSKNDKKTLWITELEQFTLPESNKEEALLILHALLIHTCLSRKELHAVLPVIDQTNIMSALIQAGIVINNDDVFSCNPIAYPSVRKALSSAAFPLDKL